MDDNPDKKYYDSRPDLRPDFLADNGTDTTDYSDNQGQDDTRQALNDQESNPEEIDNDSSVSDRESAGSAPQNSTSNWKNNFKPGGKAGMGAAKKGMGAALKAAGPLATIVGAVVIGVISIAVIFSNAIAPISFIANIVDDLGYQMASMNIRHLMLARNKLSDANTEALSGCGSILSIRCRFKTMSKKQIERYDKAGIEMNYGEATTTVKEVTYDTDGKTVKSEKIISTETKASNGLNLKNSTVGVSDGKGGFKTATITETTFNGDTRLGRAVVKTAKFDGNEYTTKEWVTKLKSGTAMNERFATERAVNAKTIGTSDDTFVTRTLKRFNISTKPKELSGKTASERTNALLSRNTSNNLSDLTFRAYDKDGNELSDLNDPNATSFKVDGDMDATKSYNKKEYTKLSKSVKYTKAMHSPVGKGVSAIADALNVLGKVDMICTIKNMIGSASVGAKVSNAQALTQFAMPIFSLAGKLKAGKASALDAQAIEEALAGTDKRKTIEGYDENGNITKIANPNYGKSALDSSLYIMSTTGKVPSTSADNVQYSVGMGQNKLLTVSSVLSSYANEFTSLGQNGDTTCKLAQNWLVRGVGLSIGLGKAIAEALAVGGAPGAVIQIGLVGAKAIGYYLAFQAVSYIINAALSGDIASKDMDKDPVGTGTACWTAMAVIQGETARLRGMIPGNIQQVQAYNELQNQTLLDYIAIEAQDTNPLDIKNQHSFIGVLATSIGKNFGTSFSLGSTLSGISSVVTSGFASILSPQKTFAKSFNLARYQQCDDIEYKNLGLATDVQCNLSYVMPTEDLKIDPDEAALYMEQNGYVEENTTTGLPKGYTPPTAEETQSFAMKLITGFAEGFVSQFYRTRKYGDNEPGKNYSTYGKYLDFCVYRSLPFGTTYEENGAINDVESSWLDGSECLKTTAPYNYFRIYTFDKTVNAAIDEEAVN